MKFKSLLLILLILILQSCIALVDHYLSPSSSKFTIKYDEKYTGLDTLINLHGYYKCSESDSLSLITYNKVIKQEPIDSLVSIHNNIMFYKNNLVCTTSADPIKVFSDNLFSQAISWGTYKIVEDTIKCQFVNKDYVLVRISVDEAFYLINSQKELTKIKGLNVGMTYSFHSLESRIDSTNWLLKKKWFYK